MNYRVRRHGPWSYNDHTAASVETRAPLARVATARSLWSASAPIRLAQRDSAYPSHVPTADSTIHHEGGCTLHGCYQTCSITYVKHTSRINLLYAKVQNNKQDTDTVSVKKPTVAHCLRVCSIVVRMPSDEQQVRYERQSDHKEPHPMLRVHF